MKVEHPANLYPIIIQQAEVHQVAAITPKETLFPLILRREYRRFS